MTYEGGMRMREFLDRLIDGGIAELALHYPGEGRERQKREGGTKGFEECRGKSPAELALLLAEANDRLGAARAAGADDYWFQRYRQLEVDWVCNCVSAALMNEGRPTIVFPTARGFARAAAVLGVAT